MSKKVRLQDHNKPLYPGTRAANLTAQVVQSDEPRGGSFTIENEIYLAGQVSRGLWNGRALNSRPLRITALILGLVLLIPPVIVTLSSSNLSAFVQNIPFLCLSGLPSLFLIYAALRK